MLMHLMSLGPLRQLLHQPQLQIQHPGHNGKDAGLPGTAMTLQRGILSPMPGRQGNGHAILGAPSRKLQHLQALIGEHGKAGSTDRDGKAGKSNENQKDGDKDRNGGKDMNANKTGTGANGATAQAGDENPARGLPA